MKCKRCKKDKDLKNFHNLDMRLDDVCSQCRAKERIAIREGKEFEPLNKEGCFADTGRDCLILKEKDCFECKFYKTEKLIDEVTKRLLEV